MAFFQEQAPRQPFLRVPPVVVWLILILIGAHAMRVFVFANRASEIFWTYGFVPARYSSAYHFATGADPGSLLDRALPFVTYMFLHGNWEHVLLNSVWLLAFGPVVARRWGTPLFIAFFLVCGIGAAATHLAVYWGSSTPAFTAPAVGASGAISGLMAAAFRMLPFGRAAGPRPLEPILSARILIWSAMYAAVNVFVGLTGLGAGTQVQLVAWAAHLGGFAVGLLLAGPFDVLARPGPEPEPEQT